MCVKVYQLDTFRVRNISTDWYFRIVEDCDQEAIEKAWREGLYLHAATVTTNDLDRAYYLTNTIDHYWAATDVPRVCVKAEEVPAGWGGWRSTSMGDVMEVDGWYYLVARYGFEELLTESERGGDQAHL